MFRKSFLVASVCTLCVLVAVMMLVGGCGTSTPVDTVPVTRPTPETTIQKVSKPTSVVTESTTAKRLNESEFRASTANPSLDIPDGRYLFVSITTVATESCMTNCSCPPPSPTDWSKLNANQQQEIMSDMIRQGAKGFVHRNRIRRIEYCACYMQEDWLEPILRMPLTLGEVGLYHVDREGTVFATIKNTPYSLKLGDSWSYENRTQITSSTSDPLTCKSYTAIDRLSFQNNGLISVTLAPAQTPVPNPTPTPTR